MDLICQIKKYIATIIDPAIAALQAASGLSLPVSIANGGTAATTKQNARKNMLIPSVDASAGTNINWDLGYFFHDTLTANKSYDFLNSVDGGGFQLRVANSGAFTLSFLPAIKWMVSGNAAPTAPSSGNFIIVSVNNMGGVLVGTYTEEAPV